MTEAGVEMASFIGDRDAVVAKKAGITVRKTIKRHMLTLDNFNPNENIDNSANGIVDDLAGKTVDNSLDCQNASDTTNDSADDLEGVKLAGWHQLGTTCPLPLGHLPCLLSLAWMLAYK
jgi:hypothetical protein